MIGGMAPRGMKHWCRLCKKGFPSGNSLGGHMNLHSIKRRRKKLSSRTLSLSSLGDGDGTGGYGLREKRHSTWLLCDSSSSDDEYLPVKKEEEASGEAATSSDGYSEHYVAVPAPEMLAYGIEEVIAARVLLMISGYSGMYSASEHCHEDHEMEGNSVYSVQKSEMELDDPAEGQTGDAEMRMPESPSSDVKMKFSSLSHVLKATATHDCKLCGKVFASSKGLASHKKFHKVSDREKVAASTNSAMPQKGQQLLEVDTQLFCLSLPSLSDRNYSSGSPKCEQIPWRPVGSPRGDRMLGVV